MGAIGDIWVKVGLKSTVGRDSTKVKGAMAKLSGAVQKHGLIAGGAMTAMGAAMLAAGDKVDKAYAEIIAGTGATGKSLDELKKSFHGVYGTIPANAKTVGKALATLNTLTGATGATLEALTTNIAEVSRMLGEDATQNAESFGQAMTQWSVPVEEGTVLMDKLFKICQDSNIGFGALTTALNKYGAVMQNAGYSVEETAQLFGKLHASGIQVSRIMPGLNAAFRKWAKEGKNAKTELEKTVTAIAETEDGMEALTIATEAFGAEGAQRLVTAIKNGTLALDELDVGLEGTQGLIKETAEQTRTFSDKIAILKNRFTELLAPLQPLGGVMATLGPALMAVSAAMSITAASTGTGTAAYMAYAIAELGVAGATKALTLALLTNPLFAGIAIGAAIIAALYILEEKFGILTDAGQVLGTVVENLGGALSQMGDILNDKVAPALSNVHHKALELGANLKDTMAPLFEKLSVVTSYWRDELALLGGPMGVTAFQLLKMGDAFTFLTTETNKTETSFDELLDSLGSIGANSEEVMARVKKAMSEISPPIAEYEGLLRDSKEAQIELNKAISKTAEAKKDVDKLTSAYGSLKSAIDSVLGVEKDLQGQSRGVKRARIDLTDAEEAYAKILNGVSKTSKEGLSAEVALADARERHNRILEDENSSAAELALSQSNLAEAEQEYKDIINGVAAGSEAALVAEMDLADARDRLEGQTRSLITTANEMGDTDEQITEMLKENNIELSQSLQERLTSERTNRERATNEVLEGLNLEESSTAATYAAILAEVQTTLDQKVKAYDSAEKDQIKIQNDAAELEAKIAKKRTDATIAEWDRAVKAIKANPAKAEIIIKKYIQNIPSGGSGSGSSSSSGSSSGSSSSSSEGEGPQHKVWWAIMKKRAGLPKDYSANSAVSARLYEQYTSMIKSYEAQWEKFSPNREPPHTAHQGGIIQEAGIYRIEMEKGEKIIPLSKQEGGERILKIEINMGDYTIHNYSDVEDLGYTTAEAIARGIYNTVGLR